MQDPNIDFKEQMIEARRTQILLGAAQVFAKKGFHKSTTKEIAQAAGVAEGTIYNYFDNKRELLLAMVEMVATQSLKSLIVDQPPDDPREFLTLVIRDRLQLIRDQGHLMLPLVAEIFSDEKLREGVYSQILRPLMNLVEQHLQHHMDVGKLRQVNPIIITRAFMGTLVVNTLIKFSGIDPRYEDIADEELIDEIISLFLDGVLASDN